MDNYIRKQTNGELRELFDALHKRLDELLQDTGCQAEPTWRTDA